MRRIGLAATTLVLYALVISATASLFLGILVLAAHFLVWKGLDFPIRLEHSLRCIGIAAIGYSLAAIALRALRGLFPSRRAASRSAPIVSPLVAPEAPGMPLSA